MGGHHRGTDKPEGRPYEFQFKGILMYFARERFNNIMKTRDVIDTYERTKDTENEGKAHAQLRSVVYRQSRSALSDILGNQNSKAYERALTKCAQADEANKVSVCTEAYNEFKANYEV